MVSGRLRPKSTDGVASEARRDRIHIERSKSHAKRQRSSTVDRSAPRTVRLVAHYRPLVVGGALNRELEEFMRRRHGVYSVRRIGRRRPVYVGESHTGRAWKTMLRHFQACESFRGVDEWCDERAELYEIAFFPTRTGDAALDVEQRAIRRLNPSWNTQRPADDETPF